MPSNDCSSTNFDIVNDDFKANSKNIVLIDQQQQQQPVQDQQQQQTQPPVPVMSFQVEIDDSIKRKIDEKLRECSSGDSDSDSELNAYTPKAVDLPSAQRLAKRLYYLDGFKPSDVVRHLCKKLVFFFLLIFSPHFFLLLPQMLNQLLNLKIMKKK